MTLEATHLLQATSLESILSLTNFVGPCQFYKYQKGVFIATPDGTHCLHYIGKAAFNLSRNPNTWNDLKPLTLTPGRIEIVGKFLNEASLDQPQTSSMSSPASGITPLPNTQPLDNGENREAQGTESAQATLGKLYIDGLTPSENNLAIASSFELRPYLVPSGGTYPEDRIPIDIPDDFPIQPVNKLWKTDSKGYSYIPVRREHGSIQVDPQGVRITQKSHEGR